MADQRQGVAPWLQTAAAVSWRVLALSAALVVVILLLAELSLIVLPLIIALLLTTVLGPPAWWLQRRGTPPAAAAGLVVVAAVVGFFGLFGVLVPTAVTEFRDFGDELTRGWEDVVDWLVQGPFGLSPSDVGDLFDQAGVQLRENAGTITTGVLTGAVAALEFVVALVLTVVILFFLVKDADPIVAWLRDRIPFAGRADVRAGAHRAWRTLGGYIRGAAIVALADAVGIAIGLVVIGVPLVFPLAFLTFVGGFFPIVGAVVAGLVAVLVALVSGGLVDALLVLAVVVGVQQLESNLLQPVVMGRAVRLHPLVVLVALTSGGVLAGIVGAFLAVPVTAVVAGVGNELRMHREAAQARSGDAPAVAPGERVTSGSPARAARPRAPTWSPREGGGS